MHEAVTKSSTATKSYFPNTSEDLLAPVSLANPPQTTDTLGWTHDLVNPDSEGTLENWNLSMSNNTTHLMSRRRPPSAGLQKISFPSNMSPLTDSNSSAADISVLASDHAMASSRWPFNTNGQLDSDWNLADEIVRLKIGEVDGDAKEDVHGQIRTPPKSKLAAVAVTQFSESSPLETSSDASADSSPHASDHQISISHSRGSSTDTTISSSQESALSAASNTMLAPSHPPVTPGAVSEAKERPHSFSGALSSADLRRLQNAGEGPGNDNDRQMQQQLSTAAQFRESISVNDKYLPSEQLSYPSLANTSANLHRPQPQPQLYDYRSGATQVPPPQVPNRDDIQIDYNIQQRNYNPALQGAPMGTAGPTAPFMQNRQGNAASGLPYRQLPRAFPQQGLLPSPTMGYPAGHHTSHLSLGNTQQLYDMMLPGPHDNPHPGVTRIQQQHNVFRGTHQHSASDPSALRDPATLALLNNNMQAFTNGMFPPNMGPPLQPLYPGQFYGTQDAYSRSDATAQVMAARLQSQFTGSYGVLPPQGMGIDSGLPSPSSGSGQNGPSANNRKLGLYKTELCRSWEEKGTCRYGTKCQFAHGEEELRKVARHPKYKTEICRTFWVSGSCPYGKRCCFIHTELPASGATAATGTTSATDGGPPSSHPDGRTRSLSTNSDPNESSVSLLARISAKRNQEPENNSGSPDDMIPANGFQFSRPPTGSLRVDTSALEGPSLKQNKSAYPSFASNGVLLPASDHISSKSPGPVTAGPDLGRHNNSRVEIVGFSSQTTANKVAAPSNSNIRHSFNGTEIDIKFSPSPPVSGHSSYALSSGDGNSNTGHVPRMHGHVRAGSAGNWGSFSRSNSSSSPYPHSSSPGGDITNNSPWSTTELAVGSSRLHEKAWA